MMLIVARKKNNRIDIILYSWKALITQNAKSPDSYKEMSTSYII